MNLLGLAKQLIADAVFTDSPGEVDPLSQYIVSRYGKHITYLIPCTIFLDFNFTELRKKFSSFEVELRSGKQYYKVTVTIL